MKQPKNLVRTKVVKSPRNPNLYPSLIHLLTSTYLRRRGLISKSPHTEVSRHD